MANTDERLDVTDAQFVDVMHTNSNSLLNGGLSFPVSIGHVDFWPNGGILQPVNSMLIYIIFAQMIIFFKIQ